MIFRGGGILPRDLKFYYNGKELAIVSSFFLFRYCILNGRLFFRMPQNVSWSGTKSYLQVKQVSLQFYKYNPNAQT